MPYEEAIDKAMGNLLIAQDIDKKLPEYNLSFVGRSLWAEWNYPLAYQQLTELLELSPDFTDGLEAMAELLMANGYFEEAAKYTQKCLVVDPLSANHFYTMAYNFYFQNNYKEALKNLDKAIDLNPDFEVARLLKMHCKIWLNQETDFTAMLPDFKEGEKLQLLFDCINAKQKPEIDADLLEEWQTAADDQNQIMPYELYILANSGHEPEALQLLKKYVDQRRGQLMFFKHEPFLRVLKSQDDFNSLFETDFKLEIKPGQKKEKEQKISKQELDALMKRACEYISTEKPFLDPQLSLSALAGKIDIHPNKLSYLINDQTGSNFNEFVNRFRLEHFKSIALKPEFSHITILGLAFESGFNSKSVFNNYFKKTEGVTPAGWIKSARAQ
jgi:AraC-like DNA-binding protein